ncbi:MAG: glycosyltransferase, partial [Planctomycetaceae bacterium]|nr:glycosyltransferase [Planctomycetaceae bacterium]
CIVGKSPTDAVRALADRPGIVVTGGVPDIRPWLRRATCAVIPLRIARGIQNKVLEAMACGLPVICSPAPLQSLAAESGVHLLRADAADEWVDAVTRVLRHENLREELGMGAAAFVRMQHSWDACLMPLDEMLQSASSVLSNQLEVNQ